MNLSGGPVSAVRDFFKVPLEQTVVIHDELDLPLGDPRPRAKWTVMVNVLGGDYPDMYSAYLHCMARDPQLKIHMYGKDVKPGRKVGHVNTYGDDLADVRERARHAADYLRGTITE